MQTMLFRSKCQRLYGRPRKALVDEFDAERHLAKEACDISHFRLMHRLLASKQASASRPATSW